MYTYQKILRISYNMQDFNPTYTKSYQNMEMIRTLPCSSVLRLGRSMTQRMPSSWWGKCNCKTTNQTNQEHLKVHHHVLAVQLYCNSTFHIQLHDSIKAWQTVRYKNCIGDYTLLESLISTHPSYLGSDGGCSGCQIQPWLIRMGHEHPWARNGETVWHKSGFRTVPSCCTSYWMHSLKWKETHRKTN